MVQNGALTAFLLVCQRPTGHVAHMADLDPALLHEEEESPTPGQALADNRLRREFVDEVIDALDINQTERVQLLVDQLHPADIADLIELLDTHHRALLIPALGERLDADVIAELNDWVRDDVFAALNTREMADVVGQLDTDDAVAIIEDLEADQQREVLRAMPMEDRAAIEEALTYPEESAGRLMQRDLIAVPEYWTVGQVIDHLRDNPKLTTEFWEIFVVDPQHKPVGTMRLSWILRAPRAVNVIDVMARDQTLIPVDMDREELAYKFQQYALISAAVTDDAGRLVGVITVDDVLHVIQEEAQEDILKLAGAGDGDINEPILDTVKSRVKWLVVNFGTAVLASFIISLFQESIQNMVALAILMPIVASMGGNAGTQTMTVAVRALATNQLTAANATRIVWRETRIALLNGLLLSLLVGAMAGAYFQCRDLGLVIGAAMMFNIMVAGLAGVLVPLGLDKANIDPAVSSSVFVTMFTDVMGFMGFLGLATMTGIATRCT
jgi:magnesium transporter